jgi:hypothetical protein
MVRAVASAGPRVNATRVSARIFRTPYRVRYEHGSQAFPARRSLFARAALAALHARPLPFCSPSRGARPRAAFPHLSAAHKAVGGPVWQHYDMVVFSP